MASSAVSVQHAICFSQRSHIQPVGCSPMSMSAWLRLLCTTPKPPYPQLRSAHPSPNAFAN